MYERDAEGNYIPNGCYTQEIRHHHDGDENNSGSCFSRPIYHFHDGNENVKGDCFSEPIYHTHKGNSGVLGGCYTVPVTHVHKGNEKDGGECYQTPIYHTHTGDAINGGGCYGGIVEHIHTDECFGYITVHTHSASCFNTITKCPNCGERFYQNAIGTGGRCLRCGYECEFETNCGYEWNGSAEVWEYGQVCRKEVEYYYINCGKEGQIEGYDCSCRKTEGETIDYYNPGCGKTEEHIDKNIDGWKQTCELDNGDIEGWEQTCPYEENQLLGHDVGCGMEAGEIESYARNCGQTVTYTQTCTKKGTTYNEDHSIKEKGDADYYRPNCTITSDGTYTSTGQILTDSNGQYKFIKLNAMKKYYVVFVYNGMLYINVEPNFGEIENGSKSTEAAFAGDNRSRFNSKFTEIGSHPKNYYSPSRGGLNEVFLQEDIAATFRSIAEHFGDHGNSNQEVFAYDCRISAASINNYPVQDKFSIYPGNDPVIKDPYLYEGENNPKHINLGIKARPTFDLALYKDAVKAEVIMNGKTETYTYDARTSKGKEFDIPVGNWVDGWNGVQEYEYHEGLRGPYLNGSKYTNAKQTRALETDTYTLDLRPEEIANGNSTLYEGEAGNKTGEEKGPKDEDIYKVNIPYDTLELKDETKNNRLQIYVTYKVAVRNQSDINGSVTEIVDYYDSNYAIEEIYSGDKDGNKIETYTNVKDATDRNAATYSTHSIYSNDGDYSSEYTSTKQTTNLTGYKTVYIRPQETVLGNDGKMQYIYIKLKLVGHNNDAGTLLTESKLLDGSTLETLNLAEINGYKTYGDGLIDRDSNPGNLNIRNIARLTQDNLINYPNIRGMYEDDTSRAPAFIFSKMASRTIEGNVFEDANTKNASNENYKVLVGRTRFGNGTIDNTDKKINGVKVELVEIKDGKLIVRATTYTNENGWYGFKSFVAGDYTVRFTYGADDKTALTKTSQYSQGLNDTSYNGQDYKSTIFTTKQGQIVNKPTYKVDTTLQNIYKANNEAKNSEESQLDVADQVIQKYELDTYYWFDDEDMKGKSDAQDDSARREQVNAYANTEYKNEKGDSRAITNHKAEVFNSYINQKTLRKAEAENKNFDKFTQAQPMDENVDTEAKNRVLVNELERRTYMYAYTPEINVEVEYTTRQIGGNKGSDAYTYKIKGVDFGVIERPRAQLTIDQDIDYVKVTATDGVILLELKHNEEGNGYEVLVNNGDNYMWKPTSDFAQYDKDELLNIILDDELLSGAKLEVRYKITVTNNSELDIGTTRATNIINYVANNLNFDLADNLDENDKALWEVVKKDEIQTTSHSTFINKGIDLSTQTTILKATKENPLTTTALKPGDTVSSTLTVKKTLSSESSQDDLTYTNMSEIVEISNEVGRYDHGAIPGNQSLEKQPREHDTSGASRYNETDKTKYPPDGPIIVTPPTGSTYIYYTLGIALAVILAGGIFLIKKFVLKNK